MPKKYSIDFTINNWYVYNKKTDLPVKFFRTRQQARNYIKKLNNKRKVK